jgi:dTDP-4-amino-4,6-dideoxygalactose transaminase
LGRQKVRGVEQLALFGGRPAFDRQLHVGYPNIPAGSGFYDRVRDIFARRWLTNDGELVQLFEQSIADLMGVEHCIAMCNGTVALEIATRACGLTDEAIVPAFTFIATAHALQWQGIAPVFVDVEPVGHHLAPELVEAAITPRTSGIVAVHVWGRACDVEGLQTVADAHHLPLIYDAAHALGCSAGGRMIGGNGNCEVLSFHATKVLNTFEGGAVLTNDSELAERMRLMRNFGFAGYDRVVYVGTNGKMSEIAAAMGLSLLEDFDSIVEQNGRAYRAYAEGLGGLDGVRLQSYDAREHNNYQYVIAELDEAKTGLSRDDVQRVLRAENVLARRYFYPGCHHCEPYLSMPRYAGLSLPVTERIAERVLALPTGPSLSQDDVSLVCDILQVALGDPERTRRLLAASST